MADTSAFVNKVAWVDLSTTDVPAAGEFYARLFGWQVQVSPDPQYGGYAIAQMAGGDVAGIGPSQNPAMPPYWMVYIGTTDADALAGKVPAAGGVVIAPPFDVGPQGRMAVFQDPAGAFISAWQPADMDRFHASGENQFGWAELNSRALHTAIPFYEAVFGWTHQSRPMGEGRPPYTEFRVGGDPVGGALDMNPMVPAEVPSHWAVYFNVADVDTAYRTALEAGGHDMMAPTDFPGGRFAFVTDPQGASLGLLRQTAR